ncbi:response regulator [Candidatus Margulisiibacteriota bacterium]
MTKVLIVDDSIIIQKELEKFFVNHMSFQVVGLGKDGNEAVELYKMHKPDLVTLDITMPNKSGLEALEEILKINPNAKVIMISVLDERNKISEAIAKGAVSYIVKPLKLHDADDIEKMKSDITRIKA